MQTVMRSFSLVSSMASRTSCRSFGFSSSRRPMWRSRMPFSWKCLVSRLITRESIDIRPRTSRLGRLQFSVALAVIAMVVVTSIERPGRGEGCCPRALDGQHFLLFRVACFVDPFDVVVGKLLKFGLGPVQVVLGNLVVVLQATYLIVAIAADVTGGDAGVFHALPHLFGYLPSAVLRQLGQGQPDDGAVVAGVEAEVRFLDGLLNRADRAAIPRLDDYEAGVRGGDGGELVKRGGRAVAVYLNMVHQCRAGSTGADAGEVPLEGLQSLLHTVGGVEKGVIDHARHLEGLAAVGASSSTVAESPMVVPPCFPEAASSMLWGIRRLNTTMGREDRKS